MSKELTSTISSQITDRDLKPMFDFYVNTKHQNPYLLNWNISFNIKFGAASGTFSLSNDDSRFGEGGTDEIKVGQVVEFIELYGGDTTQWKSFYGIVNQKSISKQAGGRTITLNCLDYISVLKNWDIDLAVEGTRVEVSGETLDPVYLTAPNDDLAQLFNFANNSIASIPIPLIKIRDKNHTNILEPQYDGFEVLYSVGQLKLGYALNVRENYDVVATYSHYIKGKYVEDVIEQILTQADGYGNYLFGESSAQAVIDNHLTTTYQAENGTGTTDTLTSNALGITITIETTLNGSISKGANSIILTDTTGFPDNGTGSVSGDSFTWTGKESGNTLTGISGLESHADGAYVKYEETYTAGQVWATTFDNITTDLTASDFTIPSNATFRYFDKRFGRLILNSAISISEIVTCDTNYTCKTLAATGIEINRITFRPRETANALEAIKKAKKYCAPNYIIRTQGDNKIWASYLNQKSTANYTLDLISSLNYLEDEDLYTRVKMWAKNKQPTNIMFGDSVDYSSDTEDAYTGIATKDELSYFGEEKSGVLSTWAKSQLDEAILLEQTFTQSLIEFVKEKYIEKDYGGQPSTGKHIFGTVISDDRGKIILGDVTPTVYINNVPIDNSIQQQTAVPIVIRVKTETVTEGGGKSKSVSTYTLYYYTVIFPHSSVVPDEPIYLYDNQGVLRHTLAANDPNMDYAKGIWTIPGTEQNDINEILSTATYHVLYSSDALDIVYEDVIFKIDKTILPEPTESLITATFEYWAIAVGIRDIDAIVDGKRDTQFQVEFFGEPPGNFHLATIDLGSIQTIQAMDLVGGFYKPDSMRKFDCRFSVSLESSTDGTNFTAISDKTDNFEMSSGEAISFEEEDLGMGFQARYLKFNLQSVDRINYGKGRYVVAITEFSAYSNIILESEATLIPTTTLTGAVGQGDDNITVTDTTGFSEPESGETATVYINKDSTKSFTYTGISSGNTFTGCTVDSGVSGTNGQYVSQTIVTDTTVYDPDGLLPQLKGRMYKKNIVSDRNLYLQSELDDLSKDYLEEFYKNHSKIRASVLYAPYLKIGQTVSVTDSYNNVTSRMYFIESIGNNNGRFSLVLARYPK